MSATPIPERIAAIDRPVEALMKWYFCKALMTVAAFPVTILVFYFRYHTMRYKFDGEGIRMSWGILFRHEIMLNYSRIQDIHLKSSLLERLLGLARIEIQTAAGSSGTEMTLEGLTDHEAMRDFLYSRMRGAREHDRGAAQTPAVSETEMVVMLQEIAAELRAIRTLAAEPRPRA